MKELNLIKLHCDDNNSVMVFNTASIMAIDMNSGSTTLYMNDSNEWSCNETTTKIHQMIGDTGFIRAHSKETNYICLFNMFYLQTITRDESFDTTFLAFRLQKFQFLLHHNANLCVLYQNFHLL